MCRHEYVVEGQPASQRLAPLDFLRAWARSMLQLTQLRTRVRLAADGHALLQGVSPRQLKRLLRQTLELVILCAVCGRVQWRAAARTRL